MGFLGFRRVRYSFESEIVGTLSLEMNWAKQDDGYVTTASEGL